MQAGTLFVQSCKNKGLSIAPKSTVIASSIGLARKIRDEFKQHGISIAPETSAPDLGLDRGNIKAGAGKAAKRYKIAMARGRITKKIASLSKSLSKTTSLVGRTMQPRPRD